MKRWNELSIAEKSAMMNAAVKNGLTSLSEIRDAYNSFAEGGDVPPSESWTMEDEAGYNEWKASLPANLRNTDLRQYDMRGAYKAGLQMILGEDGQYHLQSRDPITGKILKSPTHPTFPLALMEDARQGYYPVKTKDGYVYTDTWEGNKFLEGGHYKYNPMPILNYFDTMGSIFGANEWRDRRKHPKEMPPQWNELLPTQWSEVKEENVFPNFSGIKTADNFGYNLDNMNTAYKYFRDDMGLNDYQIASLLANGIAESGFNPRAHNPKTSAKGLYQWLDGRYKYSSDDLTNDALLKEQLEYVKDTLNNTTDKMSWNHGGEGSGYNRAVEAYDKFNKANNLYDAVHSFTYGYNRPDDVALRVQQRYALAQEILKRMQNFGYAYGGPLVRIANRLSY